MPARLGPPAAAAFSTARGGTGGGTKGAGAGAGGRWWRGEQPEKPEVGVELSSYGDAAVTSADMKDFGATMGKRPSLAPAGGLALPGAGLEVTNLLGERGELRERCRGRLTLATFGFKASGDGVIAAFRQGWEERAAELAALGSSCSPAAVPVQFLEVNMAADVVWQYSFLRGVMVRSLRGSVPERRHATYMYHLVDGATTPLQEMGFGSKLTGYARLIGPDTRMHWLAQGAPDEDDLRQMHEIAAQLLRQPGGGGPGSRGARGARTSRGRGRRRGRTR
jgi:hypothetical protein